MEISSYQKEQILLERARDEERFRLQHVQVDPDQGDVIIATVATKEGDVILVSGEDFELKKGSLINALAYTGTAADSAKVVEVRRGSGEILRLEFQTIDLFGVVYF